MLCRRLACLAPLFLVLFAVLSIRCELQLYNGYRVKLLNSGRDPIHFGSHRVAQGQTETVAFVGGQYERVVELSMTRNDINLGKLKLTEVTRATHRDHGALITMTEPVYFDFQFVCDEPSRVSVEYIKP